MRQLLSAKASATHQTDTSFEGAVGTVFEFIGNPHLLWANGDLEDKRLVLKLAFAKKVPFNKDIGFGTTALALPFRVLEDFCASDCEMVEDRSA